ncbi:MAG: hypothetical protein ACYDCL_20360 [Myxococcales bacterium]
MIESCDGRLADVDGAAERAGECVLGIGGAIGESFVRCVDRFAGAERPREGIRVIDDADLSHGEEIVAEAQAKLGALVEGDGNGAKIASPPQLCSGSLRRVELSAGGSVCVSSGLRGEKQLEQQLGAGGFTTE